MHQRLYETPVLGAERFLFALAAKKPPPAGKGSMPDNSKAMAKAGERVGLQLMEIEEDILGAPPGKSAWDGGTGGTLDSPGTVGVAKPPRPRTPVQGGGPRYKAAALPPSAAALTPGMPPGVPEIGPADPVPGQEIDVKKATKMLGTGAVIRQPGSVKATIKTTGSKEISYAVTAVSDLTGEEGLPEGGYRPYKIIAFSKTNPVLLTLRHHGYGHRYGEGGIVFLSRFFKMAPGLAELNGQNFPIRTIDRDRIALLGLDGRNLPAYPSGGWVTPRFDARNNSGNTKTNNIINWNPLPTKDTLGNALTKGRYTYNMGLSWITSLNTL